MAKNSQHEEDSKEDQLKSLIPDFRHAAKQCDDLRNKFVFYVGNPEAKLFLLGEAPGADEEEEGLPFCGKSGELLRSVLMQAGLKKSRCYITNCLKYRPRSKDVMGKENRTPTYDELMAFRRSLLQEIAIVQPELVLCIGGTAAKCLTKDKQFKITQNRGDYFNVPGVACSVMATFHPSFLIRQGGERCDEYPLFVSDIKEAARIYEH